MEYKVRESAGSYIKFRNIQVRGVSKYEVRGKKSTANDAVRDMARWRCGLQGCVQYKVRKMPERSRKKRNFGAEYKVVWSTRLHISKIN